MVTKKDLVIAVLITFCLTAIIFMINPIKSANNTYDPLLDANHDGTINLQDLVLFAQSYGTKGDPTINVNVVNPTYEVASTAVNISWTDTYSQNFYWLYTPAGYGWTGGYDKIFIHLFALGWSNGLSSSITTATTAYVSGIWWNSSGDLASIEQFDPSKCNITIPSNSVQYTNVGEFEIKAESIEYITFAVTSAIASGWLELGIHTYVTN